MTPVKLLTLPIIFVLLVCPVLLMTRMSFAKPELSEAYKIVYESDSGLSHYIAVMKADGSDPLNLTRTFGLAENRYSHWSPDGMWISYTHGADIYIMKPNGADKTNLTAHPASDGGEVWSPDSSQIVFSSWRDNDIKQIFIMNADGSKVRQLTYGPHRDLSNPVWSPDGSQLALSLDFELVIMHSDGSNPHQITDLPDNWPDQLAWSPDGSMISFVSEVRAADGQLWEQIFVIKPDGSELKQLTDGPAHHRFPAWSPDSSQILFRVGKRMRFETDVYVMNADGTHQLQLTDQPVFNGFSSNLTWSPDGRQIAYIAESSFGNLDIYVMNANGSDKTRLTTNSEDDVNPQWRR